MNAVKYPNVTVKLIGCDGNAFAILGKVLGAMRKAGAPKADLDAFHADAISGDYNKLLATVMNWVNVT